MALGGADVGTGAGSTWEGAFSLPRCGQVTGGRGVCRVVPPFHLGEEGGGRGDSCQHRERLLSLGLPHFTGNGRGPLGANREGLLARVQMEARLQGACRSRPRRSRLPFWGPNVPTDPRAAEWRPGGHFSLRPGRAAQGRTWLPSSWGRAGAVPSCREPGSEQPGDWRPARSRSGGRLQTEGRPRPRGWGGRRKGCARPSAPTPCGPGAGL